MAGCLIHHIYRLVRQKPLADIALGQMGSGDQRVISDADTVMQFVFLFQPAQHEHRVLYTRLIDKYRLEAPCQCGILLDIFAIFIQCCRPDAMQLATRQRRFQQVGGIHRPVGLAGTDQLVHLVYEQHDTTIHAFYFLEHSFQPFLELTAIFRTGDQGTHIQGQQLFAAQRLGHIMIDDPLGQAFGNRCLTDPGLADQYRVVFGPAGENLDCPADLGITTDNRVQFAGCSPCCQIYSIAGQGIIGFLGLVAIGGATSAQGFYRRFQRCRPDTGICHQGGGGRLPLGQCQQHGIYGDELVTTAVGISLGVSQQPRQLRVQAELGTTAGDFRQFAEFGGDRLREGSAITTGLTDKRSGDAVLAAFASLKQAGQQMQGGKLLVAGGQCLALGSHDRLAQQRCIAFCIHPCSPSRGQPCPYPAH